MVAEAEGTGGLLCYARRDPAALPSVRHHQPGDHSLRQVHRASEGVSYQLRPRSRKTETTDLLATHMSSFLRQNMWMPPSRWTTPSSAGVSLRFVTHPRPTRRTSDGGPLHRSPQSGRTSPGSTPADGDGVATEGATGAASGEEAGATSRTVRAAGECAC